MVEHRVVRKSETLGYFSQRAFPGDQGPIDRTAFFMEADDALTLLRHSLLMPHFSISSPVLPLNARISTGHHERVLRLRLIPSRFARYRRGRIVEWPTG